MKSREGFVSEEQKRNKSFLWEKANIICRRMRVKKSSAFVFRTKEEKFRQDSMYGRDSGKVLFVFVLKNEEERMLSSEWMGREVKC